jgi:hypothetical protein
MRNKQGMVSFRLTYSQMDLIREAATRDGVSVHRFIHDAAMGATWHYDSWPNNITVSGGGKEGQTLGRLGWR